MSTRDSGERYDLAARTFHWLVALAIPFQFGLGWASEIATSNASSFRLVHLHYQLGILVAVAMVARVAWRVVSRPPKALRAEPAWRRRLASTTQWSIYLLLFVLPVSGYVIWVWMGAPMHVLGIFPVPRFFTPPSSDETGRAVAWYVHYWAGWGLLALVSLHVGAALWHQCIRRDGLVRRRML